MKKQKMTLIRVILLAFMLIILLNPKVLASDTTNLFQKVDYTEDFKKWLELSDEEKKNTEMPRIYEVENTKATYNNPLYLAKRVKASINARYSLKEVIPSNLTIKNQQQTNSCWTFAILSSLETNLALSDYKKGIESPKVYDFSERHMEYATSKTFLNNKENKMGYNRQVGSGGSYQTAQPYLTNGTGAILESEMPFENNENMIDISQIQNKNVASQLYDTVLFPDYIFEAEENRAEIMNTIKQHIQNYGAVYACLHGNSSNLKAFNCYNNDTGAKYCNSSVFHSADHAVSIIGWDDNYDINNFAEEARPKQKGAWIVRNSWGEFAEEYKVSELKDKIFETYEQQCKAKGWNSASEIPNSFIEELGYTIENDKAFIVYGDHGIIYVSYEDINISKNMFGIEKATDSVDYDYIYQYDELFPGNQLIANSSKIMLGNVFNKKTTGTEYLTQVSIYAPETYTCKVYVNPNGTSKSKSDLQLVQLKAGESETFNAGYHTLEFSKPVEIKSNSFVVMLEIQGTKSITKLSLESKVDGEEVWDSVTIENGKCFFATGNDLENCEWIDLSKLTEQNSNLSNGDTTIKAFTTTQLLDNSLKNIEIITPPNKTSYFEGENFDKTGMVIRANYNRKTNPSVILDSSSYNITNGTDLKEGQTSVTITYEDKSVNQTINVEKNTVTELVIKTPPTKIEYKEGQNFDKTGMVVEAKYKDETSKVITDYTIENGNNLKADQTKVKISYGEKTVEQNINVTPNPLIEIKVTEPPNKTKYVVGQDFDKTGMIVTGTYQDQTTQEIIDYIIENGTKLTKEQKSITIKYGEKTTTQAITVEEKAITKISISKNPTKIEYIQNKEELNLEDGLLKVNYNDNTEEEIKLTDEQIKIEGFDNSKIGKNTITVTYQEKTTTFEVEIILEQIAKNSNFDKANCVINSAKYYTFTNKNTQEYLIIDVTINDIIKENENDSYEYYYYLSSNKDESNIEDWVKITENQIVDNKLSFEINTKDINNYEELSNFKDLYLYIKEVAVKGGNQSIAVSNAMEMNSNVKLETYLDDVKVNNTNQSIQKDDDTTSSNKLPNTGVISILTIISVVAIIGIVGYIRYKNLSKYVKK